MNDYIDIENRAGIARVTCGWKRPELSLDRVRPYWRDVHSPAIARRAGLYEYRHYPLDPVRADLFGAVEGIETAGVEGEQLMWLSDVRYADEAAMIESGASPNPHVISRILGDIEMIVDKSTTYKVIGDNGRTFIDTVGPAPQGPAERPTFGVFFRSRGDEPGFRAALTALAARWAATAGVLRVRLALFDTPDMEAERKAGYPVKTHPFEMQYQAWIDLTIVDEDVAKGLLTSDLAEHVHTVHAYPAPAVYTFNFAGRPTLSGLRGYMAVQAIKSLGADHQRDVGLLEWMYGAPAHGGPSA